MDKEALKKTAAYAALQYIDNDCIVGVGTGTTVNYFIEALGTIKSRIDGAVSSSLETTAKLKALNIPVYDLNSVNQLPIYVDGADEVNQHFQCIKGGGGALTGEKIIVNVAQKFICIADASKKVSLLGQFPVAVEVIPMARSFVAREIVKLGGDPVYRQGFVSDYGNVILDVHNLSLVDPLKMEHTLNNIAGVVSNGIFAQKTADILLLGSADGVLVQQK